MPSPAFIVIPAGGNIPAEKPTLTYTSYGAFTIGNFNSALTYNLGGSSSRSSNIFNVTATNGSGTISATSPKGQTSATTSAYRLPYGTYFVQTGDPYVTFTTDGSNGGTYYAQDQWNPSDGSPAGFYAVITPGYYAAYDYTGSGYTYNSTYNEWWKIV